MAQTWLPGDTRQRIQDLIKDSNITQAELAVIIGLSESALSRYLKGQTEMLGDGYSETRGIPARGFIKPGRDSDRIV